MSNDFKIEYLKKLIKFNRGIYGAFAGVVIFAREADITKSTFLVFYYVSACVLFALADQYLFVYKVKTSEKNDTRYPYRLIRIRTYIYVLLISVGSIITELKHILLLAAFLMCIYTLLQDIMLCDVFNYLSNMARLLAVMFVATAIMFFTRFGRQLDGIWILTFVFTEAIVLIIILVMYDIYCWTLKNLDNRYTKLYFQNSDLLAENEKLVEFREKVEKVNSEINFQKLNLTKANDDLEKSNEESRSLIEMMKYFSASFDVEKNVHVMIENIMKIKKAGSVGFLIDKGVYMNDSPYLDVISASERSIRYIRNDLYDIYSAIKRRNSLEPLVLCYNYDYKYPYLTGAENVCNAVAFPAYENDNIYGVMVVTSSKYEFFLNGYSFYESSVMDFTSALISDRLYLVTEDMAKKDGLTKLYNRVYFNQFYPNYKEEVVSRDISLTVAMMDIDHFKNINDTYGHLAGDEVIKMVASVDDKYAKLYGGTAVRFGGEEFLLILKDTGVSRVHDILESMHKEIIESVVEFEDLKIQVNVSMGLASYPETCSKVDDVVDRADQALYYSKEHGRGRITIDGKEGE